MYRSLFRRFLLILPFFLLASAAGASATPLRQLHPAIAGNGAGFTAAWIEESAGSQVAVAAQTSGGELLNGSGTALNQRNAVAVAIAHGSSESLVIWSVFDTIFAKRFTALGMQLDAEPITIADKIAGAVNVTTTWDGSRYFVVWSAYQGLFGSFVGIDGSATAPRLIVSAYEASQPDIASDGHQFLLGYSVGGGGPLCSPCPTLPPYEVRLMRIAADGTPTDQAPLVVPGWHIRSHIASSGAELLVTLDSLTEVSFITISDDAGPMRLSEEVSLFRWFSTTSSASSDVAWDGSTYVVGWRYAALNESWLASVRVSHAGQTSSLPVVIDGGRRDTRNDLSYTAWEPLLAIAINDAATTALIVSEGTSSSDDLRAHIYSISEMSPMPAAPPATRNVVSSLNGSTSRVEWQSDAASGFLIEQSTDFGKTWFIRNVVAGNVRSATVYPSYSNLFRVSAYGRGGLSTATTSVVGVEPRRRASH